MISVFDLSHQIKKNHGRTLLLYVAFFFSVYFFVYLLFFIWTSCFGSAQDIVALKSSGRTDVTTTYAISLISSSIFSNAQTTGDIAAKSAAYLQHYTDTYNSISFSDLLLLTNALFKKSFLVVTLLIACWLVFAFSIRNTLLTIATGMTVFEHPRLSLLRSIIRNYCRRCNIPVPNIALIPSREMNALSAGIFKNEATLIITVGLLEILEEDELETVIAHEITHLQNRDVAVMSVSSIIVGSIGTLAEWAYWKAIKHASQKPGGNGITSESRGYGILSAIGLLFISFLSTIGWIITSISNLAMSRSREYEADKGAVNLTENPDALIRALLKIKSRSELPGVTSSIMRMCIDNPRYTFWDLFASHPTIDQRVDAICHYVRESDRFSETQLQHMESRKTQCKFGEHPSATDPVPVSSFGKRSFRT